MTNANRNEIHYHKTIAINNKQKQKMKTNRVLAKSIKTQTENCCCDDIRNNHCVVPPRWIVEPSDVSVERNRQIALHCQAQGVPTPVIVWKKATGETQAHPYLLSSSHENCLNCEKASFDVQLILSSYLLS